MRNIELVAVLVDKGVSGSKPLAERPEGAKLIEAFDTGQAEAIIICKLDRGFRRASDCLFNVEKWQKRGISLRILNL